MSDNIREITLQLVSVLEIYLKNVESASAEEFDEVAQQMAEFTNSLNSKEILIVVVQCFNIIKELCYSLELDFEGIKDQVLDPISMNVLKLGYE